VFHVETAGADAPSVVVKFYRRDPADARDRLATEFGGLQFLWQNGVRSIPRPLAVDRERYCAIYEYLDGDTVDARCVTADDLEASVRFLSALKALRGRPGSAALPAASEACFSLAAIVHNVDGRIDRLRASDSGGDGARLQQWLAATFEPLRAEVVSWCRAAAAAAHIPFDVELTLERRTLSPSDFGFHNAIRRPDGSLAFVDFEYFGWDDPAKTVVDFVLHPGMMLPAASAQTFVAGVLSAFADVGQLAERSRIVFPLYGLKWCATILNDFLPGRQAIAPESDAAAAGARLRQLATAGAMADRIAREYRDNPMFA
jgi:hypothetical protein